MLHILTEGIPVAFHQEPEIEAFHSDLCRNQEEPLRPLWFAVFVRNVVHSSLLPELRRL